jgi:BON domain
MAEHEAERKRVLVETPTARREVEHSETVRYPERTGASGALLAAVAVAVVALAAIAILFLMNRQQEDMNANVAQQQPPQTTIVQQPAQQPPNVVVQQPAPVTQPPVIVNNPSTAPGGSSGAGSNNDSAVQSAIDKKISEDPSLSSLGITAMVMDGKVTLMGIVHSQAEKARVERAIRAVKGVKLIDNQISVQAG